MKKRFSIFIEEEVSGRAKRLAFKEGRSLRDVIKDDLVTYLNDKVPDPRKRGKAYQTFCARPIRLSKKQLKKILEVDGNE